MRIYKAWYGPKGGHAFLSSTDPSLQLVFRQAAWITDLPGTVPTGLQWQPYFRTAIHDDYFVIIHTRSSRDTTRAGMVDSVAAFIPLTDLPLVPDLRELANNLRDSHDSDDRKPFVPIAQTATAPAHVQHPLLLTMANSLISTKLRPVIHIGQEGFDDIMLDLLQVVPKQLRHEIIFSLSFSPEDTGASFAIAVPNELASRYPQGQVLSILSEAPSTAVAALLNMPGCHSLLDFGEMADFDIQSASSLILLEQAFRLWNGVVNVSDGITLVRLLAAKSGDKEQASDVRKGALDRLTSMSGQWTPGDVLSMRNLQLERFDSRNFTAVVEAWVRNCAANIAKTEDDCRLFGHAVRSTAQQNWWNTQVHAGYVGAINDNSSSIAVLAWETISKETESIDAVLAFFNIQNQHKALVSSIPVTLPALVADAIAQKSANLGAWHLCGSALAAAHTSSHALSAVLKLAPYNGARRVAIESALSRASLDDCIAIAVREDIEEVTTLVANKVIANLERLRDLDWTSPVWFDILDQVVAGGGIPAIEEADRLLGLQTLIQRGEGSVRIWGPLVRARLADLSHVMHRSDAWKLIPENLTTAILKLTAEGWLSGVLNGTASVVGLENPLRSEAMSVLKGNMVMLSIAQKSAAQFINIINELYPQSDNDCVELLDSMSHGHNYLLAPALAKALGKLIQDRSWRSAAARSATIVRERDDFQPLCRECLSIMSMWDSIALSWRMGELVQIPPDDAWQMFEQTLVELYPHGPTHNEMWSRSRGKEEHLSSEGNGVAQWHRCIKNVRAGHGPDALSLLQTALHDFRENAALKVLRDSSSLK